MATLVTTPVRSFIMKQNFKKMSPTLTWTPRIRSIWLNRNLFTLLFLYKNLILNQTPYWNHISSKIITEQLVHYVLINKLYYILTHIHLKSYMIRVSNFARSCDYWSLWNGVNYFEQQTDSLKHTSIEITKQRLIYFKPRSLIGVFVAKKFYKFKITQLMILLTRSWHIFNTRSFYYSGYPIITHEWHLIPFLGNFYFKFLNF